MSEKVVKEFHPLRANNIFIYVFFSYHSLAAFKDFFREILTHLELSRGLDKETARRTVDSKINNLEFLGPKIGGEKFDEKMVDLDVHCKSDHMVIGVEIQLKDNELNFVTRCLHDLTKLIGEQFTKGQPAPKTLKESTLIAITNFNFSDTDTSSSFLTSHDYEFHGEVFSIITIELHKTPQYEDLIQEYKEIENVPRLLRWLLLFKADNMEEVMKIAVGDKQLEEVAGILKQVNEEDLLENFGKKIKIETSAAWLSGQLNGKQEGWKEGKQEGWKEGKQEGWKEGKQEGLQEGKQEGLQEGKQEGLQEGMRKKQIAVAEAMIKENFELEIIAKISELSLDEITALRGGKDLK
ncbi:MAG: PD-(D/E)XK nuclease family transposase [Deltaproteobacteria bacterium]|jgi:predicted transposase/invertase (TIGR01784 family)|nr:PD-(D/E)XK nuclease family transposase [Deltaproteobacteria bacterium]